MQDAHCPPRYLSNVAVVVMPGPIFVICPTIKTHSSTLNMPHANLPVATPFEPYLIRFGQEMPTKITRTLQSRYLSLRFTEAARHGDTEILQETLHASRIFRNWAIQVDRDGAGDLRGDRFVPPAAPLPF